jgi:cytochrome c oxidase subunit 4
MPGREPTTKTYYVTGVVLFVLLAATIALAELPLGRLHTTVALTIALAKTLLVGLFFMHIRYARGVTRVFAAGGFLWLSFLIGLTLGDFLTRR